MSTMRTYGDACRTAHALDLVGERWALLVVRELLFGPKRFTDLRAGLPNASPDVLTQRLRELASAGVVRRRKLAPPAGSWVYELTEWGQELEPVVIALGLWGSRSPSPPADGGISADSVVLALKAHFDPGAAAGVSATYQLHLGESRFRVDVADGRLELARGEAQDPDAVVEAEPGALTAVLFEGRPLAEALSAGDVKLEGDAAVAELLLKLFPLPEPAPTPPA